MNKAAQQLGAIKTEKKAKSSRENGKLGGRPKKPCDKCENEATFEFKDLETGKVNRVCPEHHVEYCRHMVNTLHYREEIV